MIPPLDEFGMPPCGRWGCTIDEVRDRFVTDTNSQREAIWEDFTAATELLRKHVPISRVWLGGSFISNKELPSDIDVVYLVRNKHVKKARANPEAAKTLEFFTNRRGLKKILSLRVDGFILHWTPTTFDDAALQEYLLSRGYWDDFWGRRREHPDATISCKEDAYQRRGYLEVIIDGDK